MELTTTKKNKKETFKQIFTVTYVANINKLIDESKYIEVLQNLSMGGFKTYHVNDFDKLTMYMQTIGQNDSFNISLLLHLRDTNYKKMTEIALNFDEIRDILSVKKTTMVDRMHQIRTIIKDKLDFIKAYKRVDTIKSFNAFIKIGNIPCIRNISTTSNTSNTPKSKMSDTMIGSEWENYTKQDIIDRLHLLCQKHFTLDQMKLMNVELKYVSEISNMSHEHLESYYFDVIKNIESSLKEWLMICKMYVDIEINYIECCDDFLNGKKTTLNLRNFNIDIRNIFT